ncbi:Nonribosomal peptide synthase (NRPS) [Penicillium ucsense]|uniref:Nonribosomal peptide synthase (NRPS) n=1 Tax=Penicillium ucsense TaxID=2839758 RepID=A0A8J8W0L9_9EURO|nr:Nonribosomal peptide synthase (NRPS) [Penicillium ucsense]KAF7733998.1 Nonribosomal peptide synthase (NRPS) [Penicillium ucsense]
MGDYGENTPVGPDAVQLTFAQKADETKLADQRSASNSEQTKIILNLRPETSLANLTAFCARHQCTLLGLLNVAWALVLSAYTDSELAQVLFLRYKDGIPHTGLSEIAIDGGETVEQALALVEQHLAKGMPVPSETSVTDLQNWTAADGHQIFNSVVVFSDSTTPERTEAGDYISIHARATGDRLVISIQAPNHLLPIRQAQNCAATLSHVLGEIVQNSDLSMTKINLMSPQGLEQISKWNHMPPAVVSRCVHEVVDEIAKTQSDTIAIDGADGAMSYGELQSYSNRLAHYLKERGVGPEFTVPLFFEKSKWAIVAMLGVVKAGGTIVNLDAKQPKERLRGLLAQLQATLVLTSVQNGGLWTDELSVLVISEDFLNELPAMTQAPSVTVTPRNSLYIIFTSGSTGTPKGCVVEHESFLTAAAEHVKAGNILPSSRVLQMTPYTFDVSMLEIFTTLTTGACICFCNDSEAARGVAHIINHLRISWTFMTPSLVRLVDPSSVPTLKTLALGGEGLARIDVTTWAERLHLINGYGPSECSVAATIHGPLSLNSDPANIGLGTGAVCWVVDRNDHDRLVPIGAVGELVIQGPIVARGYLNEPGKTAAVFLENVPAFAASMPRSPPAFRLYKTGDLVRQNSDGTLTFIGRKDRQVKLNGQRLELGEIEQRLSENSLIRHALVLLPKQGPCEGRLVAVLSLQDYLYTGEPDANIHELPAEESQPARALLPAIGAQLATQVPGYMVPTFWVILAALPFTTSGKVHGVAMTQWLHAMSEETYNEIADVSDEAPAVTLSSKTELQLQQILAQEMGIAVEDLKMNRSFIALGGDSLKAMKIVARCRQQELKISVADVLRAPSLIGLAERVEQASVEYDRPEGEKDQKKERASPEDRVAGLDEALITTTGLTRDQVEDAYRCTPMQDGILLSQVKFPGTYEIRRVLHVQSTHDAESTASRLKAGWQTVVNRHQALRTVFVEVAGQFQQLVLKKVSAYVQICKCLELKDHSAIATHLQSLPPPTFESSQPQHRLTICRAGNDEIFLKFEISHALIDGGSTEVILRELSTAFDEQTFAGEPARFSDYMQFISASQAAETSMNYWAEYLNGMQPTIVPMYPMENRKKRSRSVPVPFTDTAALIEFSETHGVTLANVLQTAWALVLRTYTDTNDVCFGYIAAGRDVPVEGIDQAVGAFINMLVCRVRFEECSTGLDAVLGMQNQYFDALPHQHTSLAQIQHRLNLSGMPLFNSIISVQKDVSDQPYGDSLAFKPVEEDDPTDFDLGVAIHVGKDSVRIDIGYWSSHLTEGDASNLANTYSSAISRIIKECSAPVVSLDLFSEHDRTQILAWNQDEPKAKPGVVHDYIYAKARQQPEAQAVCAWDGQYTYKELDHLSEKLAHHLAELGAGPEVLIPHCFPKSKLAAVVMLAIMKSGSAGVGLSSSHPRTRVQDIVENCAAKISVVSASNVSIVDGLVDRVVVVDEAFLENLPAPTPDTPLPRAEPHNPAFVSFTSGSTGKPKGIVLEHRSLITSILAHGPEWGVDNTARVLQFSAYAFDASVSDTFTTLVGGGTICIPHEKDRVDDLVGAIHRLNVNWAFLTPRVLSLLTPELVPTLKTVVLGGEAISKEDIARWTDAICIRVVYGPTECTIYSMGTMPLDSRSDPLCLGHAVGTRLWVTHPDDVNKLMPVGCAGELIIEGPLVTRGYLNEPVKTAAAYFEDPVWLPRKENGEPRRFYKTSDLVRYYPDGQLRFIGRKDTQIKIRGQRVELGEIEHAILESLPSASHVTVDSVVLPPQTLVTFLYVEGLPNDEGSLFLTLDSEMTGKLRALEKSLVEKLPSYMVPSLFIPISHIPMTISGKVDRITLRRVVLSLTERQLKMYALAEEVKEAPQGEQEHRLRDLWASVLRKEASAIGRQDSFFRLGGDSIGAMKLVAAARRAGYSLSVADIFRHPELTEMAQCLDITNGAKAAAYAPFSLLPAEQTQRKVILCEAAKQCIVSEDAIQDVYYATPLQEGVFLMSTTHDGAYVAPTAFNLPSTFNVKRFQHSWQELVNAHPILRTRIVTFDAVSYQVVLTANASSINWETAESLSEYVDCIRATPVAAGRPLSRFALIPDKESTVFVWTAHHALFDGWTMGLLFDQLAQLYNNGTSPTEATSFAEFVQFTRQVDQKASQSFWAAHCPQEPPAVFPRLPSAAYHPTANTSCYRTIPVSIPKESDFTMAIVLRAAWAIVLARYTDAEDILYGLTLSGRDLPVLGIDKVMGPTITTVPMNVHLDGGMSVQEFLQRQNDENVEMMRHQHMGLQAIRRISQKAAAATEFTNLFVVQPQATQLGGLTELAQIPTDMTRFDPYALIVECNLGEGEIVLEARFDNAILSMDQTMHLLGHFEHVLKQLANPQPGRRIEDIDAFSPEDERQIWEWNALEAKSENECVHELIATQARQNPHDVAIDAWDGSFTYEELDDLSTRLAHHLIASIGVTPESLVPLCFDKSRWTIVAMLAVVKSGGGCVMLNPDHPITRLAGVIADTGSSVVLASPERVELFTSVAAKKVVISEALVNSLEQPAQSCITLPTIHPKNPVFVIFTSGSSGKPKGIVVQHNSVCTVAIQHGSGLGFEGPGLRVLQFASFSFDVSMGEVFITLAKGGTLCIPTEHDRLNNLAATINRMQITWTFMAPTVAALLDPRDVPNLKTLVLGGEAVSQSLVDQWSNSVNLIDSYGPAECTIWASHAIASSTVSPANIGHGVGCRYWIVDPQDYNRLTPIGCVGELLIEGPNVSRGYLNEPEKTKAVFVENPTWCQGKRKSPYRFYCTGDLVRYNSDGSLNIAGRKDSQVKFNGQRIELSEIEFHLRAHSQIEAGMVVLPKEGPCKGKLVAVVALAGLQPAALEGDRIELVPSAQKNDAQPRVRQVQDRLGEILPPYMVPSIWVTLHSIPLTASRKINRLPISRWIQSMSDEVYRDVVDVTVATAHQPTTQLEKQLAQVWSHVLNLSVDAIGLDRSFLSLGGDSITAMQVVSRCRSLDIQVSVQDILQPKSLAGVVARALATKPSAVHREEQYDVPFELSPIQQLYFDDVVRGNGEDMHHYNQSVLLRVLRPVTSVQLSEAIERVVANNAMLRARFHKEVDGSWTQVVKQSLQGLASVDLHIVQNRAEVFDIVNAAQRSLDIENGPVFAAQYFEVPDDDLRLLSLIAHHLVIDAVSWHIIITQLEQVLESPKIQLSQSRMPFQSWIKEQRVFAENLLETQIQHGDFPAANLEYWGLTELPLWGDGEEIAFTLNQQSTALLLQDANNPLRTEPVDILLAALQLSFAESFSDREMPAFFVEGHGREPWESSIDLSETIGWFTTFHPVHRRVRKNESVKTTIKRTKDARQSWSDNGFAYFAERHFNAETREKVKHHRNMEICFNYLGQSQHAEREDAILQEEALQSGEVLDNLGDSMGRLAVFDIVAAVSHGRLEVSFFFQREIHRQDKIRQWVHRCEETLQLAVNELSVSGTEFCVSDFPLLDITYQDLATLTTAVLPSIGVSPDVIEDLYPCSPIQEGILISQARQPGTYEVRQLFKVVPRQDQPVVDVSRLVAAWQRTVDRHALLRTVFIEAINGSGVYNQLVLRSHQANVRRLHLKNGSGDDSVAAFVTSQVGPDYRQPVPAHRMTVCEASNSIYCQLEVSHALIDGTSMALLVRDLVAAYEGLLPTTPGPLYSTYMKYLSQQSEADALSYWRSQLTGVEACRFPSLNLKSLSATGFQSKTIEIDTAGELKRFCEANDLTMSNLFQVGWGLVLRAYTGSSDVCFGYMAAGRDIPVEDIYDAIGPFINLLVCRMRLHDAQSALQVLQAVQSDYLNSLPHQHVSLAAIQHSLGQSEAALFNTIMSLQRKPSPGVPPKIDLEIVTENDPTEYDVDLNITTGDDSGVEIHITYRTSVLADDQADRLLRSFTGILFALAARADKPLAQLDLAEAAMGLNAQTVSRDAPVMTEASIPALIDEKTHSIPTAVAIQSMGDDTQITYHELDSLSQSLASYLLHLGVHPGDKVLLKFSRSKWALIGMLSVLKIGAISLAFTSPHDLERLQEILSPQAPMLVLCNEELPEEFGNACLTNVILDATSMSKIDSLALPQKFPLSPSPTQVSLAVKDGNDWALLAHQTITTAAKHLGSKAGLCSGTRVLQLSAVDSPLYLVETLFTLICGGTIVVPPPDEATLVSVSQAPDLQTLVLTGSDIPTSLLKKWQDINLVHPHQVQRIPVWLSLMAAPVGQDTMQTCSSPAISRAWVRSPFSQNSLAPSECKGEVLIDGPVVPLSYMQGGSVHLLENPSWLPSAVLVRTGVWGRWNGDGIELDDSSLSSDSGEDANLRRLQELMQSTLRPTEQAIISSITVDCQSHRAIYFASSHRPGQTVELLPLTDTLRQRFSQIRLSLQSQMPEDLTPSFFIPVTAIPLSEERQFNRSLLNRMASQLGSENLTSYQVQSRNATVRLTSNESLVADLWSSVLHLPDRAKLDPSESFFRLGGDSIGAMRIIAEARSQGLVLTMNGIFQQPTLAGMAKEIRLLAPHEDRPVESFSLLPPVVDSETLLSEAADKCCVDPSVIEDVYPCTPLQEGFMVLNSQDSAAYYVQEIFKMPESVDVARFRAAWGAVLSRSTILRTRIISTIDGFFQVLLRESARWESGSDLETYLREDMMKPMTYGQPLSRFAILDTPGQHYFVWTAHHAVYDGLTLATLAKQVSAEYNREMALPEIPYNRFIDYIQGVSTAAATEFWTAQCAVPATSFPTLPARHHQPFPDHVMSYSIPVKAKPYTITLSTVLRAAWAMVLAQLTDSEHVNFGVTLSGRNASMVGINQVLGPTIATVPIQVNVPHSVSPQQFLHAVHKQAIEMIPFEHTGLQNIRRMGEQCREAVNFQNLLIIQPGTSPVDDTDFLGLTPVPQKGDQRDPYPLTMECNLLEDRVEVKAQFDRRSIPSNEMSRILKQYARTVERLQNVEETASQDDDGEILHASSGLSDEDVEQILEWNSDRPVLIEKCIHEMFEEQARLHPGTPAVSSYDVELTYGELSDLITRLAAQLQDLGIKPEMKIPLCFSKSSWTIVAMFAVFKVGGVACMLNPEHPSSRIQLLLQDLEAEFALCDQGSLPMISSLLPPSSVLSVDGTYLDSLPSAPALSSQVRPENAALVVYTSGSTGKPKGSIPEHRSLVTGLMAHCTAMGMGPDSRVFQFAAYTFDVCFEEIFGALMLGGCICVPSDDERMNSLADSMARYKVTWTELTPTVASLLLPSSIPSLKSLALSGESVTKEVVQRWGDSVQLINTYGPSECCVSSTCNVETAIVRDPSNIGRGLGCTTWIVNPDDVNILAPIGATGELLIEGPIVARGYLNEPEKTAAAFISAPGWWPQTWSCGRIYRTGDLVKYNADGTIKFIGRRDTQVKLHGQRIELGEIEHRIRGAFIDPSYQVAVEVLSPKTRGGIKILTAFICEGSQVSEATEKLLLQLGDDMSHRFLALQARLMGELPRHMIPQLYIPIKHMPLSPSRKIERKVLRSLGNDLQSDELSAYALTQTARSAPSTSTEKALFGIWAEVLGTSPTGTEDHFFHLGGDSIAAMKAVAAASKIGISLSVAEIMQFPTLRAMAAAIDLASENNDMDSEVLEPFCLIPAPSVSDVISEAIAQCGVEEEVIEDIYPCTPSQEALMALTARDEAAYVSRAVYRLPQEVDVDRYRAAWEMLTQRQSIMRTRIIYSSAAAKSFQVVVQGNLIWHTNETVSAYLAADRLTPMRHGDPLMRFALLQGTLEDPRPSLAYTAHHAVYDGWSEASMFEEAEIIYRQGLSALPDAVPYKNFIKYLSTVDNAASDTFWRSQLEGDLPAPFPPSASDTAASLLTSHPNRSQTHEIHFPDSRSLPYALPTVLKAAWTLLISRYAASEDVIFGHVLSGRTVPLRGVADMMGPTIATVPVRLRVNPDETVEAFMRRIQTQAQDMAPFEQVGMQNIRRLLASPDAVDVGHLFFIQPPMEAETTGLALEPVTDADFDFDTYPLIVECQLTTGNGATISVKYNDIRIPETSMIWLLQHFENLVGQLYQTPRTAAISTLELAGPSDIQTLRQWVGPPVTPVQRTVHDEFRSRAFAHPERCAVEAWDGALSYRDLDVLSSRFARELVQLGVEVGQAVGLIFDKSCWTAVAMMAVLKAGGCCVQLDSKHPSVRLVEIIEDTGMKHLLAASSHMILAKSLPVDQVIEVTVTTASKLQLSSPDAGRLPVVDVMSPAYMTFTSGSTGKPKSVVIDHQAIHTSIAAFSSALHITFKSRVLQFAAYTFDISYAETFAPLTLGATLCVLSEQDRLNDLAGAIARLGANWACLTPTVASLVEPASVKGLLKTLVLSGEAPTEENLRVWCGRVPNLINAYGPSEASVWCAAGPFTKPDDSCTNIGRPVGCNLVIVEPHDINRLTPVGCTGELIVCGPILSSGYLNNDKANNTAFHADLAWRERLGLHPDCSRVYRTGDLARYLPDGRIEYLGRADTQVKIYGRRIEPREIEHHIHLHLSNHLNMVDSVTLASRKNQKILVAFIYQESAFVPNLDLATLARVFDPVVQSTLNSLQAALRARLPSWMVPTLFVPLRFMPTNAAGKTDRKLLARAVNSLTEEQLRDFALSGRAAKRPLSTYLQQQLAELWADVLALDVRTIGADDTFFTLGGDSMFAMKLASRARSAQISLSVADIFNYPVLADLASHLQVQMPLTPGTETPPFNIQSKLQVAPAMDMDLVEALALKANVDAELVEAVEHTTDFQDLALVGHLSKSRWMLNWFFFDGARSADVERLRKGCHALVQQFGILRTVFAAYEGRFWQIVLREMQPSFRVETTADFDGFTQELYKEGVSRELNLSMPFVEFVLALHPDGNSHRLLMRLSHAQYDGVSLPTLWDCLQCACQGEALPSISSFTQFVKATAPVNPEATRSYWRSLLDGAKETRFVEHSKPALRNELHDRVLHVSRRQVPVVSLRQHGVTAATVLRSAWAVLLARMSASHDVTFGQTVANRSGATLPDIENIVGPCLNVVPVRAALQPGQTILDFLLAQQQQQVSGLAHESLGFRQIIRECTNWPSWTHFSSVIQHQNIEPDREVSLGSNDADMYKPGFLGADLDLTDVSVLSTPVNDDCVDIDLLTSSKVMSPFAAELLIDQLSDLLHLWAIVPVDKVPVNERKTSTALIPLVSEKQTSGLGVKNNRRVAVQDAWRACLPAGCDLENGNVDFFHQGGDLVQMAQLVSELHEKGVCSGVSLETLVQHSTLDAMVEVLS